MTQANPQTGASTVDVTGPVRVLLVDDHTALRQTLVTLLSSEPDMLVVGEAADGQTAIEQVRTLCPDVLLIDMNLPVLDGIEVTRRIRAEAPGIAILGLSMYDGKHLVQPLLDARAVGCVAKADPPEVLLAAIRSVASRDGHSSSSRLGEARIPKESQTMTEERRCALADAAVMDVTPPWPECAGPVRPVRVFYRDGGDRVAAIWKTIVGLRDQSPSGELFLCAAHAERLRLDGLRVS